MDTNKERQDFIEKVNKGLEQLNSGNTLNHEEAKQKIKQYMSKERGPSDNKCGPAEAGMSI